MIGKGGSPRGVLALLAFLVFGIDNFSGVHQVADPLLERVELVGWARRVKRSHVLA